MNELRKNLVNKRDQLSGKTGRIELYAKNLLQFCKDIETFEKEHKNNYIIERCEDIEDYASRAIKVSKQSEAEARKQVSRLNDGPKENLILKIEQLARNLSQGLYEKVYYAESASEKAALKAAESAIDNLSKAVKNGRLERADSIVQNAFKTLKQAGVEVKTSDGKDGYTALKQLKNYINSLKNV